MSAKRANEQIKLTANLLNSSAVGVVGVIVVKELFADVERAPSYTLIVVAIAVAYYIHFFARNVLGELKDETAPTQGVSV